MHEFFHGWRRKAGIVTLVMALTVFAMWMRSLLVEDGCRFPRHPGIYFVTSERGRIAYGTKAGPHWSDGGAFENWSGPWSPDIMTNQHADFESHWRWECCGFHFSSSHRISPRTGAEERFQLNIIPYWGVVLLPTLLSAYLFLWKPRKQQPTARKPHA